MLGDLAKKLDDKALILLNKIIKKKLNKRGIKDE